MINRQAVSSSNLMEIGYDESSGTMEVMFKDGSVYQYFDVPEDVYRELMGADSVGQYFHREVRGVYRYSRI